MMLNLKNLLKEKNSKCVLNVSFGLKKTKAAIIWHVDVGINFVTNVEGNIWLVNASKRQEKNTKDVWSNNVKKWNKEKHREVEDLREDDKLIYYISIKEF